MGNCQFTIAWIGKCNEPTVKNKKYCEEHLNVKCSSCEEQATHECPETMGPFICGYSLCDECEHEIAPNGTNGNWFKHCPTDEQKYLPWIMQNFVEEEIINYINSNNNTPCNKKQIIEYMSNNKFDINIDNIKEEHISFALNRLIEKSKIKQTGNILEVI